MKNILLLKYMVCFNITVSWPSKRRSSARRISTRKERNFWRTRSRWHRLGITSKRSWDDISPAWWNRSCSLFPSIHLWVVNWQVRKRTSRPHRNLESRLRACRCAIQSLWISHGIFNRGENKEFGILSRALSMPNEWRTNWQTFCLTFVQ